MGLHPTNLNVIHSVHPKLYDNSFNNINKDIEINVKNFFVAMPF
jgi:hypothetical protein